MLNRATWPHFVAGPLVEGIALIIRALPLPAAEFTIGTKKVFIRSPRTVSKFIKKKCFITATFVHRSNSIVVGFRIGGISSIAPRRSGLPDTENVSVLFEA